MKKKNIARKEPALDARLFEPIQPHGGITFADPSYIRMGDGYCRCLHIYGLPNTLDRHWLTRIFTVSGCISSFDVATENMAAVKRSINRSIGEEGARAYDAKDYNALYDAQKRQAELQQLEEILPASCALAVYQHFHPKEEGEAACASSQEPPAASS